MAPLLGIEDLHLRFGRRIADRKPHQKPVQLRLRQWIGTVIVLRILGRDNEERLRQDMPLAVDSHHRFGHALKQARLGSRRRPVDLVGENDIAENRAGNKPELLEFFIENVRSGNIARQHIRRELNPAVGRLNRLGKRLYENAFSHSRSILQQEMPVRHQADDHVADDVGFAFEDDADVLAKPGNHILHGVEGEFVFSGILPAYRSGHPRIVRIVEHQHRTADLNHILMFDLHLYDRGGVDERAVGAAEILDKHPFRRRPDCGVMPRYVGFRNDDVAVALPADNHQFPVDDNFTAVPVAGLQRNGRELVILRYVFLLCHSPSIQLKSGRFPEKKIRQKMRILLFW